MLPLHQAGRWQRVIEDNLAAMPAAARILISDATGVDDTLDQLEQAHRGDPRVGFLRPAVSAGWREHCNALLAEVQTPLAAFMPQDDSITPGHFEALVAIHDQRPDTAVSFGLVKAQNIEPGGGAAMLERLPYRPGERPAWQEAVSAAFQWNPGIAFRGVVRMSLAKPIAPTDRDRFADLVWVFGMALHGHLVELPEVTYLKRMHTTATHPDWDRFSEDERRFFLLNEVIRQFPDRPQLVEAVGAAIWCESARRMPPPWQDQLRDW